MYDLRDMSPDWGKSADFPSKMKMELDFEKHGVTPRPCLPTPQRGDLPFPEMIDHDITDNSDTAAHLKLYNIARSQEPFLYADGTGERSLYNDTYTYKADPRGVMGASGFRGGESAGLARVAYYLVKTRMSNFRSKRMYQMLGT